MDSHKLPTHFFTLVLVFLLPNSFLCRNHCDFPAIFNFGDSNSDTGGLSAAFGQAPPPHGETFFHAPAGRYSDGRLVIDFIGNAFIFYCFLKFKALIFLMNCQMHKF